MATKRMKWTVGAAALALAGGLTAAYAQSPGPGWGGPMMGMGGGHGMGRMMGERFCAARDAMAPRLADRLETTLRITDAQKADFEALRKAMTEAEGKLKTACPSDAERADRTPPGRLALAEKGMAAGLDAIRTVRPAADALYAKLDDKQRDRLRWMGRRGHGGRDGHGWWRGDQQR